MSRYLTYQVEGGVHSSSLGLHGMRKGSHLVLFLDRHTRSFLLRGNKDRNTELGLLAVVDEETLEEERSETGSRTITRRVEDEKILETSAVIRELSDTVEGKVNNLLSDGVVTTGVVVGSIFLTRDQLLRVEQLAVGSHANRIKDGGLEIEVHHARDVLARTSLREEGVQRIIATSDGLVQEHLSISLDTVLEAVPFPAGITDLDTSLTNVVRNSFMHVDLFKGVLCERKSGGRTTGKGSGSERGREGGKERVREEGRGELGRKEGEKGGREEGNEGRRVGRNEGRKEGRKDTGREG